MQFEEIEERERLLNRVPSRLIQKAEATRFGATIHASSIPLFMAPAGILLFPLVFWNCLTAFSAFLMLLLPPLLSMFLHPLMHCPYEVVGQQKNLLGYFLRTKYIRRVIRHHWLHHKYTDANFNLLLLGDYLLGTHRSPSVLDFKEMELEGIPVG